MNKPIKIEQHSSLGVFWFIGWLFTVGFLGQGFWKGLLALFVWPYFLGAHFANPPAPDAETTAASAGLSENAVVGRFSVVDRLQQFS